jgi:hypothetical protein
MPSKIKVGFFEKFQKDNISTGSFKEAINKKL